MSDTDLLAADVRRAVTGHPWFGPAALALLSDVDAAAARVRLPGAKHTIWELVLHMSVWARYVAYRLSGGIPREPEEGDWPQIGPIDAAAWSRALNDLRDAHDELARALGCATDEVLDAVTDATPRDDAGEPVTLRRSAAGVAQHSAYHLGQIAVLKQLMSPPVDSA